MLQRLYNCTNEEYFALPYASNSGIKEAHDIMNGKITEKVITQAYYFGTALDSILTDPSMIHTLDLTRDQRAELIPMARAIERDKHYQALFSKDAGGETQAVFIDLEFPISFEGQEFVIPAKCKYDWWNPTHNFGADLKTTDATTEPAFRNGARWFEYDQMAAWYMDITKSDRYPIKAISKRTHAIFTMVIKRDDDDYKSGKEKYLRRASSWVKLYGNRVA